MRLTAYLNGHRAGWFELPNGGEITLEYDRAWQAGAGRLELSWSMPKSRRRHGGGAPGNYLWNLLPDNSDVLERWSRRFGVSSRQPMGLLANVGLDAAGAVQLLDSDEYDRPELTEDGGIEPISDEQIGVHLRELRRDPTAWVAPGQDAGYFSLAGAQSKFTLVRTHTGWGIATGRTASTHIVKPGITGLARSDLNEHLTMRAAHVLGLRVAESRVMRFGTETAIVVTRFDRDRAPAGDSVVRRHQEDFAQATGVHPASKYQNEGGPGIAAIGAAMNEHLGSAANAEVARFFEATMFNWAALGTDAHAKNYALVHPVSGRRRPMLAPLYDLGSALAYPEINTRKAKLAMSYAGHYRAYEIEPRHIVQEAAGLALPEEWVIDRARHLVGRLPDAFSAAAEEAQLHGDDAAFAATLIDRAAERAQTLARQLGGIARAD
ncbi:type II toxin-antitoxin system HipA family toxin [Agromyces archimandritae]|uniref:Type II toxin-antitoxin system HipA family toxin n=1 Tax=Agromyces archimandritae TaxID=2781962 RepID=A0A975IPG2_9MICO|nr:type II toxin-antitoxin system HipA family toxin [Agromyces archimandritae]QTX05603.1 type II toxin-antitoxin system HipA family toxin [Agromyces archimandritae]